MASQKNIEIVKSTAPVLEKYGEEITKTFYKNLFSNHPELKSVFNMSHQHSGSQPRALANSVFRYAKYIDKLENLAGDVENIAHKHSSLSVSEEQYPIVGKYLLEAVKLVLKDAATDEIMGAWEEAYNDLAIILVKRESDIYEDNLKATGGYSGKEQFTVFKKEKESDVITSFYLKRKDGSKVPTFKSGQYVAISVKIAGETNLFTRNYSLSDSTDKDYLRLSIKKENGNPDGIVSNYLHDNVNEGDEISVGMPSGNFTLELTEKPVVLMSGGIGITPLLSMYKEAMKDKASSVTFIQCALNSSHHAFKDEIKSNLNSISKSVVVYNEPLDKDKIGIDFDYKGYITKEILQEQGINENYDFYFCGPKSFMKYIVDILQEMNVSKENINYEFFGAFEELILN